MPDIIVEEPSRTAGRRRLVVASSLFVGVAALLSASLIGLGIHGAAAVASQRVTITLAGSPTVAPDGASITWTGTVTPLDGPMANVRIDMDSVTNTAGISPPTCDPIADCTVNSQSHRPSWTFPMITAKTIFHAFWRVPEDPGPWTGRILLNGPAGVICSSACVNQATVRGPTIKVAVAYSPAGAVLTGSTLHFSVTATSNVGPIQNLDLHVNLPTGLGPATNLNPSSATWAGPPYNYIDDGADFGTKDTLRFDAVVTAATGATLKLSSQLNAGYIWDTGSAKLITTIHVGPRATPTPRPTATPQPTPTPGSTAPARPTPTSSGKLGTASPAGATPIDSTGPAASSSEAAGTVPTGSASPALAEIPIGASPSVQTPGSPASQGSSDGTPSGPAIVIGALAAAAFVGLGAAAYVRRPRS